MRIAIVSLDGLGDQVLRTGFVRACRQFWPKAHIAMLSGEKGAGIWEACPYIDALSAAPWPAGRIDLPPFDLAITPRPAPDWFGCPAFVSARHIAFRQRHFVNGIDPNGRFTDLVDLPWPPEPAWLSPFRLLAYLGYQGERHRPELWPAARGTLAASLPAGRRWIALAPGAGAAHKAWGVDGFAAVAALLTRREADLGVVLVGSPPERPLAERFAALYGSDFVDLIGRGPAAETAAALERCSLYIGNDSGPKHIAAAVGVPVVEVSWLNCRDPRLAYDRVFDPVGVPFRVVRPAQEFTIEDTFRGAAIARVGVAEVVRAARELLALPAGVPA